MAVTPTPMPKLIQPISQGMSDAAYYKKYGTGAEATKARIRAIYANRGYTNVDQKRVDDIYNRRSAELGKSFDRLRADIDANAAKQGIVKKVADKDLKHLDVEEIRAALKAISSRYDLSRGEVTQEENAAKRAFGFLQQNLGRLKGEALTGLKSQAAGQGLLRSGLFLRDSGRVGENFARQEREAILQRDDLLRALATQKAQLTAAEKAERAERARILAREQVGTKEAIARALELV